MHQQHKFQVKLEEENVGIWKDFLIEIFGGLYYDFGILSDF